MVIYGGRSSRVQSDNCDGADETQCGAVSKRSRCVASQSVKGSSRQSPIFSITPYLSVAPTETELPNFLLKVAVCGDGGRSSRVQCDTFDGADEEEMCGAI